MSLQSVESAKTAMDRAANVLRSEMLAAKEAGVPVAAIARAAGVTRNTAIAWLKELQLEH